MGISYGATYGIGIALEEDQFDAFEIYKARHPDAPKWDEDGYDEWEETMCNDIDDCDEIDRYLESLIKNYEFLEVRHGGNMYADYYDWYIFIKDPLEDLEWLPFKMEQLYMFMEKTSIKYYGDTIRVTGGAHVT